jgi:hypothetical protein
MLGKATERMVLQLPKDRSLVAQNPMETRKENQKAMADLAIADSLIITKADDSQITEADLNQFINGLVDLAESQGLSIFSTWSLGTINFVQMPDVVPADTWSILKSVPRDKEMMQ